MVKRTLHVLIVEDSEDDAALLGIELRRAGYEPRCHRVAVAGSMSAALERQTWDLIIADSRLPGFSGIEALDLVKERRLNVPFIIVSGLITEDAAVAAMKAGANDYVMKDKLARLGPAVERALREVEVQRDQRLSEAQLESERAFRAAIENSVPAGVAIVDLEGKQTYVNPAFCEMVGRSEAALVGARPPFVYWPPEEIETIAGAMAKVAEGKSPPGGFELRFLRPDEERIDVLVQITPLKDTFGNVKGWVSSTSDITQRKRAESRLAAEHAITVILAKDASLEDAAPSILQVLLESLEVELAALWLVDARQKALRPSVVLLRESAHGMKSFWEECNRKAFARGAGLPGRVWEKPRAMWVTDLADEDAMLQAASAVKAGLRSAAAFPVQSAGEFFGVLELLTARRRELDVPLLNMMTAISSEIGQFIRRREAEEELRAMYDDLEVRVEQRTADLKKANAELHGAITERKRLEHELLDIADKERRRIGLDLHDDLGQKLSGLALMTKGLELKLGTRHASEVKEAGKIHHLVQEAMTHARELAKDLAALDLKEQSLPAALEGLALHATGLFKISCRFQVEGEIPQLAPNVVMQLYKIAQEAVTNAIRHAKAKQVSIKLSNGSDKIILTVRNNGRPFPKLKSAPRGMGLRIMNYRAGLVGGSFEIKGAGVRGTLVTCAVPRQARG